MSMATVTTRHSTIPHLVIAFILSLSFGNHNATSTTMSPVTYQLTSTQFDCYSAESACVAEFGPFFRPASIHNYDQMQVALSFMSSAPNYLFIGLRLQNDNNQWEWADGTPFDYGTDTSGGVYPWAGDDMNKGPHPNLNCDSTNPCCVMMVPVSGSYPGWIEVDNFFESEGGWPLFESGGLKNVLCSDTGTTLITYWDDLSATLPTTRDSVFTAYDVTTDLVWIFGGWSYAPSVYYSDIYTLDITTEVLTHRGNLPTFNFAASQGQAWTTIDNIIYFVQNISSVEVLSFNMTDGQLVANNIGSSSLASVQCMAAYGDTLLILTDGRNLNIYNFTTQQWIAPSMLPGLNVFRDGLTCQVYSHYLYAIGGDDGWGSLLNTIEKLDLSAMINWEILANTLSYTAYLLRSTVVGTNIVVTGGWSVAARAEVNVISTVDDSVSVQASLNHAVSRQGIVTTANNEVVVIGGRLDTGSSDTTNIISVSNPIFIPDFPTMDPTTNPSENPTKFPTLGPSPGPTIDPTFTPTQPPTVAPTLPPTQPPTSTPSFNPTVPPTNAPILNPTNAPTLTPTIPPSLSPTSAPTTCHEGNRFTDDGYEPSITDLVSALDFNHTIQDTNKILITSKYGQFLNKRVTLFQSDHKQEMRCNVVGGCQGATIEFRNNTYCHLVCNDFLSCYQAIIKISDCQNAEIICNGNNACNAIEISAANNNNQKLSVYCGVSSSCANMLIIIDGKFEADITCMGLNACDNLLIDIDFDNFQNVKLNMLSYSGNVTYANGFGYEKEDASEQYMTCNTKNHYIKWDNDSALNTPESLRQQILEEYTNNSFPCDGTVIECFTDNSTNLTSTCEMKFVVDTASFGIVNQSPEANCYWISVSDIIRISCDGECASSPTYSPSNAPTNAPTIPTLNPTYDPTKDPTVEPTNNPSSDPTVAPSVSPSIAPSNSPSFSPSFAPTDAPSNSPSFAPSISPSISPSNFPSIAPSNSPSFAPSFSPTPAPSYSPSNTPSNPPSDAPSEAPTVPPTVAPSNSPSIAPSNAPSSVPSIAPTAPPTEAPTNSPTVSPSITPTSSPTSRPTYNPIANHDFDSSIDITFLLENLESETVERIATNPMNETSNIHAIIKGEYQDESLPFEKFLLEIEEIEGTPINEIDANNVIGWTESNLNRLRLKSTIECNVLDNGINYCASITLQSQENNDFSDRVTYELREYYSNNDLDFSVLNPTALSVQSKNETETKDYMMYIIASLCGFLVLIGIFAFLYNKRLFPKLPGFNIVDDGKWAAVLIFSLQLWDFYSDINLSVEMWNAPQLSDNILILVAALGSTIFVLIPFLANLAIAARIKTVIKNNEAAKGWFQNNTAIFVLMVVCTGGCYAALAMVSSNIFGLRIMSCGLTQCELKKLTHFKVIGTVVLENVPQLLCQILYAYSLNTVTEAVQLAAVASILSVTASTLSWLIERDSEKYTRSVSYFLAFQCENRTFQSSIANIDDSDGEELEQTIKTHTYRSVTNEGSDAEGDKSEEVKEEKSVQLETIALENITSNIGITDEEKRNILATMGRRDALGENIAEVFEIPTKNIEIGHSRITKFGVITHVIHYVYDDDLESTEEELQSNNLNINVTPSYFTEQLFVTFKANIAKAFRDHFQLNNDFSLQYYNGLRAKRRRETDIYGGNGRKGGSQKEVLKKVVTQINLNLGTPFTPNSSNTVSYAYGPSQLKQEMKALLSKANRLDLLSSFVGLLVDEEKSMNENDIEISDGLLSPLEKALTQTMAGIDEKQNVMTENETEIEMQSMGNNNEIEEVETDEMNRLFSHHL